MPSREQRRTRLVGLLKELFQLNQPDLDFGFYRIMHAKSAQVTDFLELSSADMEYIETRPADNRG